MTLHWRNAFKRAFKAAFTHPLLDARGRQSRLYNSRGRMFRDDPAVDFPQAEFERIYRRLFQGFDLRRSPVSQLVIAVVLLALLAPSLAGDPSLPALAFAIAVVVCALIGARTTRRHFWGASADEIAAAMLDCGRCPSCAYRLAGIPADPDGCTTCPECAAAWRLPDPIPRA